MNDWQFKYLSTAWSCQRVFREQLLDKEVKLLSIEDGDAEYFIIDNRLLKLFEIIATEGWEEG